MAPREVMLTQMGSWLQSTRCSHVCSTPTIWSRNMLQCGPVSGVSSVPHLYPHLQCVSLGGEEMNDEICRYYFVFSLSSPSSPPLLSAFN